ncbi:hypothetical protein BIV23_38735 [Streptomyces monashensis]|uniref:Uncharacterized protein n=1 Tax=Streptomyces monashensis TaxID=1678012 RepID=A0A1S2PF79_9ACTN|nr:hypothetical protein BIV23_38735 [Streptomyces monashensis]
MQGRRHVARYPGPVGHRVGDEPLSPLLPAGWMLGGFAADKSLPLPPAGCSGTSMTAFCEAPGSMVSSSRL